jgi:hypothetical protein
MVGVWIERIVAGAATNLSLKWKESAEYKFDHASRSQ